MMNKRVTGRVLLWRCVMVVLLMFTIGFIWSNSLRNATASTEQSGFFKDLFRQMFDITQEPFRFLYNNLRKVAHFSEFALLGAEAVALLWDTKKGRGLRLLCGAGACLAVAVVDETIQYFVPGRYASFIDVCIDGAGVLCGMLFCCGAFALLFDLFKKK
ncbi:MAG: VanZ family protein [Clostridia bacterium]|nr:VanZ family protein [Clostridia bacterium]